MRIALFLACLLLSYLSYDVTIRLRSLFKPRDRFRFISEFQHRAARRTVVLARFFGGLHIRVSPFAGRLPPQCLVISNHQSLADIPVLMYALPALDLRFVAKRELRRRIPGVSITLRNGEHALIGRKSGFPEARRALRKLAQLAHRGVSPVVFPEGTRSRDGEVGQFHPAAVRILTELTELPILSVALEGGYRISRLEGLSRNLRGTSYRVEPLTLYPHPCSRAEFAFILAQARDEIARRIGLWRAGPSSGGAP